METENGVTIYPGILRDLWFLNRSAPCLLRSVQGDFAAQTRCGPAYPDRPAIGGILLWQDEENWLRLGIGIRSPREVSLEGSIANQDIVFGRGLLAADSTLLRLERNGERVRALCSAEGQEWFIVGECRFPAPNEVQVGIHAIGNIDRTIYYGAFTEGAAIRFDEFALFAHA